MVEMERGKPPPDADLVLVAAALRKLEEAVAALRTEIVQRLNAMEQTVESTGRVVVSMREENFGGHLFKRENGDDG